MNYQERIEQVGAGKKPSKAVQKILDEYEAVLDAIDQGKHELSESEDVEETEKIQNDLIELEETAELMLMKLDKAIDKWADGIKRIEVMNNKKNSPTPAVASQSTSQTPQPSKTQTQPQNAQAQEVKKSDSGYGWLIFGGLALVLSLGAINVMKSK